MKKYLPKTIGRALNILSWFLPRFTRETAFRLLSRVQVLPVNPDGQAFFDRGETQWLSVGSTRTALHKWGHGPVRLLFLHGWMSHSQRWEPLIGQLDPNQYTAYALDAPGHGLSEGKSLNLEIYREAYRETLRTIGGVDILVCHSLGNLVGAYQYLYEPSEQVGSYVVLGSPAGIDAIFGYFVDIMALSPRMLRNLRKKTDLLLKVPHEQLNMRTFFERCDAPMLVVHDRDDAITPFTPMKNAVSGMKHIECLFTEGLDHTLRSPKVDKRIMQFIEQHSKTRSQYVLKEI